MAPLETLNDEERQYHEVRNDTVENLQKVASLDTGKRGIIARHELEARYFRENQKTTNETIKLSRESVTLTRWVIGLTVAMLLMVGFQAWIAWRQTKIIEKEYYAKPDMQVEFVNRRKVNPASYAYELRIKNMGAKVTDHAILHMYVPDVLDLDYLKGDMSNTRRPNSYQDERRVEDNAVVTHYEWHVPQRYYIGRPRIFGTYVFRFKKAVPSATIDYQVVTEGEGGMEAFVIRNEDFKESSKITEAPANKKVTSPKQMEVSRDSVIVQ